MALAFLPSNEIESSFNKIEIFYTNFNDKLNQFFQYFRKHWIKNIGL